MVGGRWWSQRGSESRTRGGVHNRAVARESREWNVTAIRAGAEPGSAGSAEGTIDYCGPAGMRRISEGVEGVRDWYGRFDDF